MSAEAGRFGFPDSFRDLDAANSLVPDVGAVVVIVTAAWAAGPGEGRGRFRLRRRRDARRPLSGTPKAG